MDVHLKIEGVTVKLVLSWGMEHDVVTAMGHLGCGSWNVSGNASEVTFVCAHHFPCVSVLVGSEIGS